MKYYISDLHLFHENAIKFDHRPFESVQEMHEVVLENWNDRVTNGDFVYLLGDMSLRGKNEDLIAFVARLNGNEIKSIWQLIGFTSLGVCCRGFESHQNFKSSVAQLVEHRFNPIISPKGCRQLLLLTSN